MNEYEFDAGRNHDQLVDSIISQIEGPIIVPADGVGRWSRMWSGVGLFSDSVSTPKTHWRVKQISISETLDRLCQFENPTLILMFCYVFMKEEVDRVSSFLKSGGRLIFIDVLPPPKEWGMRAVNDRIYEIGYSMLFVESSLQDMRVRKKGVKFSTTLLSIPNPKFLTTSIYSDYYNIMRPFRNNDFPEVLVFASLEEEVDHLNSKLVPSSKLRTYSAYIGAFDVVPQLFVPASPIYVRTMYRAGHEWSSLISHECLIYRRGSFLYFAYPEADATVLDFIGASATLESSLKIPFNQRTIDDMDISSSDVLQSMFTVPGSSYNKAQIQEVLPDVSWQSIEINIRNMNYVEIKDGYYVVKEKEDIPVLEIEEDVPWDTGQDYT